MRASYFITDCDVTLELIFESVKAVPDHFDIHFDDKIIALEVIKPYGQYEFLKIEEETRAALLEEWYEENEIFELLFNNPLIPGKTRAFYLTFSQLIPASKLLKYVTQSLIANPSVKFVIYDCMNQPVQPTEFLESLLED